MYDRNESPIKSEISDSIWKTLPKWARVSIIKSEWDTLSENTKACAHHIHEEEMKAVKGKKAEEDMQALEEKRSKLPNKNKNGGVKKNVYGVVTKEEAKRLRQHWFTLNRDYKTKCYEMYKEDEYPTNQNYNEWKSMDQKERKEEVLEIWPTLSDDMKACVIHIADGEKKLGEKIVF